MKKGKKFPKPSSFVNIELYQTIVSHFQQKGLARLLVRDIDAFHDLVDFEWLLAERAQDILSFIQHDQTPTAADVPSARAQLPGAKFLDAKTGDQNPRWAGSQRPPSHRTGLHSSRERKFLKRSQTRKRGPPPSRDTCGCEKPPFWRDKR